MVRFLEFVKANLSLILWGSVSSFMIAFTCVCYCLENIQYLLIFFLILIYGFFSFGVYVDGQKNIIKLFAFLLPFIFIVFLCGKFYFDTPYRIFKNKGGYVATVSVEKINRGRIKTFDFSISAKNFSLKESYLIKGDRNEGESVIILIVDKGDFVRMVNDCPSQNEKIKYLDPIYVDASVFDWNSLLY